VRSSHVALKQPDPECRSNSLRGQALDNLSVEIKKLMNEIPIESPWLSDWGWVEALWMEDIFLFSLRQIF
jgi:hypothetical protein